MLIRAKQIFFKNSIWISNNAEFHADFKSVKKVSKKRNTKKVIRQTNLMNISKNDLLLMFIKLLLLITFFVFIFFQLFQQIWNQREILRFLIPLLNLLKKTFFALTSTFGKLWLQLRRKWLKKTENLFLWMCLRILLGNRQRVCITKLFKLLYPNTHTFSEIFNKWLNTGSCLQLQIF